MITVYFPWVLLLVVTIVLSIISLGVWRFFSALKALRVDVIDYLKTINDQDKNSKEETTRYLHERFRQTVLLIAWQIDREITKELPARGFKGDSAKMGRRMRLLIETSTGMLAVIQWGIFKKDTKTKFVFRTQNGNRHTIILPGTYKSVTKLMWAYKSVIFLTY